MKEHVVTRVDLDEVSFEVRVNDDLYKKFGPDFLKHHFDKAMVLAIADLMNDEEWRLFKINNNIPDLKESVHSGYKLTLEEFDFEINKDSRNKPNNRNKGGGPNGKQ